MNFLAHHALARRDLGSPVAAVGAMLPDLWRMVDRRVRPAPEPPAVAAEPALAAILDGISHHLALDVAFHRSAVFLDGESRLRAALRRAAPAAPKIALFAHLGWELCLDGALVRSRGVAPIVAAIADGLDGARAAVDLAARVHHFVPRRRPDHEADAFAARLRELFDHLVAGELVGHYAEADGVRRVIERIRRRFGFAAFSDDERVAVARVLAVALDEAEPALARFFDEPAPLVQY